MLRASRDWLGEDDELTLAAVGTFAGGLDDAGRFDEAEPVYRENLADRQRLLASDDRRILASMNDLAICLKKQKKLEEAAQLSQKELKLRETLRGPHH
ncbi:MAG: tetratricopeptide repeat protein, partial [Pirellula sp.]